MKVSWSRKYCNKINLLLVLLINISVGFTQDSNAIEENQAFRTLWFKSNIQSDTIYPFVDKDFEDAPYFSVYREKSLKAYIESYSLMNRNYLEQLSGKKQEKFNFQSGIFGEREKGIKYLPKEVFFLDKMDLSLIAKLPLFANKIKALVISSDFYIAFSPQIIEDILKQFTQVEYLQLGNYFDRGYKKDYLINTCELENFKNLKYISTTSSDITFLNFIQVHQKKLKGLWIEYITYDPNENFPILHMNSLNFLRFNYQGALDGSEFKSLKELKTLVLVNSPSSYDTTSIDLQKKYTKTNFALTNPSIEYIGVFLGHNIKLASFSNLRKLKEISLNSSAHEIKYCKHSIS